MNQKVRRAILLVGATCCLLTYAQADTLLTTHGNLLAVTDQPVPGPSGAYFGIAFDSPAVADDGTVLFRAVMYGGDVSGNGNARALFRGTSAADLSMMVRSSDPAPGLADLILVNGAGNNGIQAGSRLSPDGRTFWSSYLSGPGVASNNDTAFFGGLPGNLLPIVREGDAAPGTSGAVFFGDRVTSSQFTTMNRNGAVLFQSTLSGGDVVGTTNNQALYAGTAGALSIVVRKGDTVLAGPVTASAFNNAIFMDGDGRVLYNLTLAGTGVTAANNGSLALYTPGTGNTILVREGQSAPGTAGATFNNVFDTWVPSLSPSAFNNSGQYVMTAELQGGDVVDGVNDRALYVGSASGDLTIVARRGDPAPGTDALLATFATTFTYINNAGVVLTVAFLQGGTSSSANNAAVYVATPTGNPGEPYALSLVMRAGDPAPGAPGDIFGPQFSQAAAFNDLGQAVFNRDLQGPDVVEGINDRGVWGWDPTHGLFILARAGDQLEVAPDLFWTASAFGYLSNSNTDGSALGLSKTGTFAMNVNWLDGGSSVVTIDLGCYPPYLVYPDVDGDGYGDPSIPTSVCANATPPAGHVPDNTDCNDASPAVHPGASDAGCNGIDENCSGATDEGYVSQPTNCGVGACVSSGGTACVDGAVVDSCVPGAPSAELCNGIDDDCDGAVDNAAPPSGALALHAQPLGSGAAHLTWNAAATATGYDLVTGSLQFLQSSGGDFSAATTQCLANDHATTSFDDSAVPASGQGFWYALRAVNCGGNASYDSGSPSQVGSRDAEIAASGHGCP